MFTSKLDKVTDLIIERHESAKKINYGKNLNISIAYDELYGNDFVEKITVLRDTISSIESTINRRLLVEEGKCPIQICNGYVDFIMVKE